VNFLVGDLGAVRRHLRSIGCPTELDTDEVVVIDPEGCCGARYGFTASPMFP
jgi:hypothetical protein